MEKRSSGGERRVIGTEHAAKVTTLGSGYYSHWDRDSPGLACALF